MQFGGYSVDNIGSFRRHFSMRELLDALDIRIVFGNWLKVILSSGGLEPFEEGLLRKAEEAFYCWTQDTYSAEWAEPEKWAEPHGADAAACREFLLWEKEVAEEKKNAYRTLCRMLCCLLAAGGHTVSEEEYSLLRGFFEAQGILEKPRLSLCVEESRPRLYFRGKLVEEYARECGRLCEEKDLAYAAAHPDTGYLGITEEGELKNGSAFEVPPAGKKAVKVCINQGAYAVLYEDGSIAHNLHGIQLPETPLKNIALAGARLEWETMDEEG